MQKIKGSLLSFDGFGDSVSFSVKNGEKTYKTWPGAICGLLIFCIIVVYGGTKFIIMKNRLDTKQVTTIQTSAFPSDQVYSAAELDFDFQFWLVSRGETSYSTWSIEEAKQFINVTLVQLGTEVNQVTHKIEYVKEPIRYEACTDQQLEKYVGVWPGLGEVSLDGFRTFKANCIKDKEKIRFMGDSKTLINDLLEIHVEKCVGEDCR